MWELSSSVWGWRQQFSSGLIQLNMATHSSFKQTKAANNDQCCHYGQLIWSGPMCCWFLSFMALQMCVTGSICVTTVCVCVCVPIQILCKWRFGAKSLERFLSFNWHLHTGRIINFYFRYYLSVICVNVSRRQCHFPALHPHLMRPPSSFKLCVIRGSAYFINKLLTLLLKQR